MASLATPLDLLRCPRCWATLDAGGDDVRCADGHRFGLIGGAAPDLARDVVQRDTLGQMAMRFRPLVRIYESVWRPLFTATAGGTDPDRETAELVAWLDVAAGGVVLDVACGPGNTTRRLAAGLPGGRVLGVDLSVPMLEEAVRRSAERTDVGFARVDAHRLPMADASVDGAHCAAALYLFADPGTVIGEVARVLRPGGRFVGMTLVSPFQAPGRLAAVSRRVASSLSGVHYFGAEELERLCTAAGLVSFASRRRGAALLFRAERTR